MQLLVEEYKTLGNDNPILFSKFQGERSENLNNNDFALVIQTSFQSHMLKTFGNGSTIFMDSTHKTTAYDFFLITLLVKDEKDKGFPVGWCVSNREDASMVSLFLSKIKEKSGEIKAARFMSDDAPQYYNSWSNIFGDTTKLLCTWHVKRAWKKNY